MKRPKNKRLKKCRNYNRIVNALSYVKFSLIQDVEEEYMTDYSKIFNVLNNMEFYIFNNLLKSILNNEIKMSLNGVKKLSYLTSIRLISFSDKDNSKLRFIYENNELKLIKYINKYGLFDYD